MVRLVTEGLRSRRGEVTAGGFQLLDRLSMLVFALRCPHACPMMPSLLRLLWWIRLMASAAVAVVVAALAVLAR